MTRNKIPIYIPDHPDLSFEQPLWENTCLYVAGIDEAGRGAWAGPVAAGAVILSVSKSIPDTLKDVNDSKQLSPKQRERLAGIIKTTCLSWGVGMASSDEIDQIGILPATRLAIRRAMEYLKVTPQHLLLDYITLPDINLPQTPLVKGDARSLSIAAASILAKTSRDELMIKIDKNYPEYGFARHKGYGTDFHQKALTEYGPCSIHRFSFKPVHQTTLS